MWFISSVNTPSHEIYKAMETEVIIKQGVFIRPTGPWLQPAFDPENPDYEEDYEDDEEEDE